MKLHRGGSVARVRNMPVAAVVLDPDMPAWLKAEAQRQSTNVSTIVRQAIRALMERPAQRPERQPRDRIAS
jgi:hypothetical protein